MNPYFRRRITKIGPKIDLGCGHKCREGHIGVDIRDLGQDIVWDLRFGLPFPDNSVTNIFSSHFIEHLTDEQNKELFEEILRICQPGAVVQLHCPHESTKEAFFHNHLSKWSVKRIEGMILGFNGAKYWKKSLRIDSAGQVGIELVATLVVVNV